MKLNYFWTVSNIDKDHKCDKTGKTLCGLQSGNEIFGCPKPVVINTDTYNYKKCTRCFRE